jgi:hypothetical protein
MYKEQVRLNQAASNALMARLEAQRAICDAAEKDLHKKYKIKDDIEKQIRPEWEQGRKRFRIDDSSTFEEERSNKHVLYLPENRPRTPFHKELRVLMEEEQNASENEEELNIAANNNDTEEKLEDNSKSIIALDEENSIEHKLHKLEIVEGKRTVASDEENSIENKLHKLEIAEGKKTVGISFRGLHENKVEEDEETRNQRGKGNVEKWLEMLLENGQGEEGKDLQETNESASDDRTEDIIQQLNQKFPQKELKVSKVSYSDFDKMKKELQVLRDNKNYSAEACVVETNGSSEKTKIEKNWKVEQQKLGKKLVRSESAKVLRRIPSSPSLFQGMKSSIKVIKKAVKL